MEEGGHHSEQFPLQLYNLHGREVRERSEGGGGGCENVLVYSISKHKVCNSVTTGQDQMTAMKMCYVRVTSSQDAVSQLDI